MSTGSTTTAASPSCCRTSSPPGPSSPSASSGSSSSPLAPTTTPRTWRRSSASSGLIFRQGHLQDDLVDGSKLSSFTPGCYLTNGCDEEAIAGDKRGIQADDDQSAGVARDVGRGLPARRRFLELEHDSLRLAQTAPVTVPMPEGTT